MPHSSYEDNGVTEMAQMNQSTMSTNLPAADASGPDEKSLLVAGDLSEEIRDKINAILTELFEIDPEKIEPSKHLFEDFGLDSLDAIDMAIRFQKEFQVRPSNEELMQIRTVADIYNLGTRYATSQIP